MHLQNLFDCRFLSTKQGHSINCTSIDPKQFQNDSFGPYLGTPDPPKEQTALSMIFVGVDIANVLATREDKRRAGQQNTRGGQDPVTEPGHSFQGGGQSVCPVPVSAARTQEKDKRRTTARQQKDKRRTRPGHRARPQSSSARPVSVASSLF